MHMQASAYNNEVALVPENARWMTPHVTKKKVHGRKLRLELGEENSCKLLAAAITAMPDKLITSQKNNRSPKSRKTEVSCKSCVSTREEIIHLNGPELSW